MPPLRVSQITHGVPRMDPLKTLAMGYSAASKAETSVNGKDLHYNQDLTIYPLLQNPSFTRFVRQSAKCTVLRMAR